MNFQYPSKRQDIAYIEALPSDETFFSTLLLSGERELKSVEAAITNHEMTCAARAYLDLVKETSSRRFYHGTREIPALAAFIGQNYPPDEISAILATANRVVEGKLEASTPHLTRSIHITENRYPWFEGADRDGLPRFGALDCLTRAYALTNDPKIVRTFAAMTADFLKECPVPKDGTFRIEHGAWHPLTAAVRIFSWAPAFVGFLGSDAWPISGKLAMVKSFYQHGHYIRHFHAAHGNHALMQMRALILIALLFPELRESRAWLDYALSQFPPLVAENVYADGVQFEGSPGYHVVVMHDLYGIVPLLRRCGIEIPEGILKPLENMFEVLMHSITPDLDLPRFGDTDTTSPRINRQFKLEELMAVGALLFRRPDFKYLAPQEFPLSHLWQFGPGELELYRNLKAEKPAKAATYFPVGGYMVSRESWDDSDGRYLMMRAGVGIGGHCHADALSIIARAFGKELIVDSGKGVYEWSPQRKYLVSTRAHNTVVVDGQDQHVRDLHWNPPPSAPCQIWDFRTTDSYDFFHASHYGYTRLTDPVVHTRKVLYLKHRYWVVIDLLEAEAFHEYELYFHLPVGEITANSDLSQINSINPGGNILVASVINEASQVSVEQGLFHTQGAAHKNPVVKHHQAISGKAIFITLLVPFANEKPVVEIKPVPVSIDGLLANDQQATGLAVTVGGVTDYLAVNHTSINPKSYLDYNGNPVMGALLTIKKDHQCIRIKDRDYYSDVVISHEQPVPSERR